METILNDYHTKDKFDKDSICDILEQAETISQRVLESIQETASTTHCKKH